MENLIRKAGKFWQLSTTVASVFMLISVIIVVVNIITRRFFNAPIFGSTEIVQYIGLAITSFAIAQNEWGDGNITMAIIVDRINMRTHYLINAVEFFAEAVVFAVIDWLLIQDVIGKIEKGNLTSELRFPKWIPSAVVAVGFILLTAVLVVKGIIYLQARKANVEVDFNSIGRV